jgi:GNAT superfamily N-acetyltransferase
MLKVRTPEIAEWPQILEFLNQRTGSNHPWSVDQEYPLALNPKNIHNIRIVADNREFVSHALMRPILVKTPFLPLKVAAIGSVYTNENFRKKGFSSAIIDSLVESAIQQECDIAILWTDQYDFYRRKGFELSGFEFAYQFPVVDFQLPSNLRVNVGVRIDPESILRVYNKHTVGAIRQSSDIARHLQIPQSNVYTLWSSDNQLQAYAVEGKGADLQNYIHEWGGDIHHLSMLLKWIPAHRQAPIIVIVPGHSQRFHEEFEKFQINCGFLGMIKVLNPENILLKLQRGGFGAIKYSSENKTVSFGEYTWNINESKDWGPILFGSPEFSGLNIPFWIWGWDSV